eukprot:TRINITY_DN773_c2_g2_i1.p1 TRINITY_DN773_c2_g2~~TRINITY_DN773_c2_g2_i1.p1  ORF type:complete len:347 (+),score=116.17 TRINITY_DN773_c2_g2_i1:66-1106(+)
MKFLFISFFLFFLIIFNEFNCLQTNWIVQPKTNQKNCEQIISKFEITSLKIKIGDLINLCGTIKSAIDSSLNGDVIYLLEGTYRGTFNSQLLVAKNLFFTASNGVIIDLQKQNWGFLVTAAEVSFNNIEIKNGVGQSFSSDYYFGAITLARARTFVGKSYLNITNVVFKNNEEGALYVISGSTESNANDLASVNIKSCIFQKTSGQSPIKIVNSVSLECSDSQFFKNVVEDDACVISLNGNKHSGATFSASNLIIEKNSGKTLISAGLHSESFNRINYLNTNQFIKNKVSLIYFHTSSSNSYQNCNDCSIIWTKNKSPNSTTNCSDFVNFQNCEICQLEEDDCDTE